MQPDGEGLPPKLKALFGDLEMRMVRASQDIKFVPPYEEDVKFWEPMGKRIEKQIIQNDRTHVAALIKDMEMLEDAVIALSKDGQGAFAGKLNEWKKSVHGRVDKKTVAQLNSEVKYGKWNYFYKALVCFLGAFLLVMCSWLAPRSLGARICTWIALGIGVIALILMIMGITHRCLIMERSPVGNLYDTIIFIGATGVLVLLLTEVLTRRMVALGTRYLPWGWFVCSLRAATKWGMPRTIWIRWWRC